MPNDITVKGPISNGEPQYRESLIFMVRGSSHKFPLFSTILLCIFSMGRSEQLTLLGWGSCADLVKIGECSVAVVIS